MPVALPWGQALQSPGMLRKAGPNFPLKNYIPQSPSYSMTIPPALPSLAETCANPSVYLL